MLWLIGKKGSTELVVKSKKISICYTWQQVIRAPALQRRSYCLCIERIYRCFGVYSMNETLGASGIDILWKSCVFGSGHEKLIKKKKLCVLFSLSITCYRTLVGWTWTLRVTVGPATWASPCRTVRGSATSLVRWAELIWLLTRSCAKSQFTSYAMENLCLMVLKGQCHEIFDFFSRISFPQAPEYTIKALSIFFAKIRRDICSSRCTIGVVDTGGKCQKT